MSINCGLKSFHTNTIDSRLKEEPVWNFAKIHIDEDNYLRIKILSDFEQMLAKF